MRRVIDLLEKVGIGTSASALFMTAFALEGNSITCGQAFWLTIIFGNLMLWLAFRKEKRNEENYEG